MMRLCHIDMPPGPGTLLTVWQSAGEPDATEPLETGQGFTIDVNGDRWRALLESWDESPDGTELHMRIERRYG
jgi:hypothetical protein